MMLFQGLVETFEEHEESDEGESHGDGADDCYLNGD